MKKFFWIIFAVLIFCVPRGAQAAAVSCSKDDSGAITCDGNPYTDASLIPKPEQTGYPIPRCECAGYLSARTDGAALTQSLRTTATFFKWIFSSPTNLNYVYVFNKNGTDLIGNRGAIKVNFDSNICTNTPAQNEIPDLQGTNTITCQMHYDTNTYGGCQCPVTYDIHNQTGQSWPATSNDLFDFNGQLLAGSQDLTPMNGALAVVAAMRKSLIAGISSQAHTAMASNVCPSANIVATMQSANLPNWTGVANVYGTATLDASKCSPAKVTKTCCCKVVEQGQLTTKYSCALGAGTAGGPDCTILAPTFCSGTACTAKPLPNAAATDGGCGDLGSVLTQQSTKDYIAPASGAGITTQTLEDYAAGTLNPGQLFSPTDLIGRAVKGITLFIGSILLALYAYAGVLWMFAQGNSEAVSKAKTVMIWSTLGVIVILSSYLIISFIFTALGNPFN